MGNIKFRRQYSVGNYILDFYCPEVKLAIEIDGEMHFNQKAQEYDSKRQKFIESLDITMLRFTNKEVTQNLDGVLFKIQKAINILTSL